MPENNKNYTEGKIIEPLMRFAMPVMFALFLQAMYGAVDFMVVGKTKQSGRIIGAIFRGMGDSKTLLVTVAIACAANITGDLFLVAVLGRIPEILCHRLSVYLFSVLLCRVLQRSRAHTVCNGPGYNRSIPCQDTGMYPYEQMGACNALSYRTCNTMFHSNADHHVLWMYVLLKA